MNVIQQWYRDLSKQEKTALIKRYKEEIGRSYVTLWRCLTKIPSYAEIPFFERETGKNRNELWK